MNVILLEKIRNLGDLGDLVAVKPGYGRNCLIPQKKAVSATKANKELFQERRQVLEKKAAEALQSAQQRADKLNQLTLEIGMLASDEGKLYGSVGVNEVVIAIERAGHEVKKQEVILPDGPIYEVGEYEIQLQVHSDVTVTIKIMIVATTK